MIDTKKARPGAATPEQATDKTNEAGASHCDFVQAHDTMTAADWQGKLALRPCEMAAALGIGVNSAYQLCHRRDFPAVWIGRTCIIPTDGLRLWLDNQVEGGAANDC